MMSLLESCRIAPPPGSVAEQSLPLIFFDITWLHFHPIRQLLFYEFPCPKPYFLETLLPKLKESLSLTLKHFFPMAGHIVYPLNPDKKPVIRYQAGDSVSLTIFESSDDFDTLVGNHARDADKFYDFIPQTPAIINESGHQILQALALQVTLFPGRGVCIGFSIHHSVGDATSFAGFITCWASVNKLGGEDEFLITKSESLPIFDKSVINYPHELDSIYWNHLNKVSLESPSFPIPTNRVRATYVFSQSEIKKLKDLVQARTPSLAHVSSFVVMAAHIWTCFAKSLTAGEEEKVVGDDEVEFFLFAVDLRARINPPVPENYFGNCLSYGLAKIRRQGLVGDEGFFLAAQAIAEEVQNRVINIEKIMEGAETWLTEIEEVLQKPILSVSGSTRFDLYSADFGWGKARKMEISSTDGQKYAMSLCKSRDSEGGLEVGLSLPKVKMDAFAALFANGIKSE